MTAFDPAKAFDQQFPFTTPNSFPSIYSAGALTNMASQLSISSNFGLLGQLAACDTETALAPVFSGAQICPPDSVLGRELQLLLRPQDL